MDRPQKLRMNPLKRKTRLYEDIVQQFMRKIDAGELKAGDRLPTERELVDQLGVSRTSVREALRAMELLGMIVSKVGEGTFVRPHGVDASILRFAFTGFGGKKNLLEIYEMRLLLETFTARQAARKRTVAQLAEMHSAIKTMKDEVAGGNRSSVADKRFHLAIATAAGNDVLLSMLSLCSEMINSSIAVANAHVNINDIMEEHQKMYAAIEQKDEKTAERLMRAHIKRAYDRTKFFSDEAQDKQAREEAFFKKTGLED
jgi:GntR family transcriptional repressor for pyruvate dehydrogenase complex